MRVHLTVCVIVSFLSPMAMSADTVRPLWPDSPPSWDAPTEPERDITDANGRLQAGRRVTRLTNVAEPSVHIYEARNNKGKASETAVVICPGGGFNILAWDLEGTEIAEQFQAGGVTAILLKYRVPTRKRDDPWTPVVQDVQRAIAMTRSGQLTSSTPTSVGCLGFSAGGNAVAHAATAKSAQYESVDSADEIITPPDFACLVYPAWLVQDDDPTELRDGIVVDASTPPMFIAHAENDRLTVFNAVTMFSKLHQAGVPSSLHVFTGSGHGFGARDDGMADDYWVDLCLAWLVDAGLCDAG
ncbi:MAG: alpha/beta hydrolase [Planctomycetota bacterium]